MNFGLVIFIVALLGFIVGAICGYAYRQNSNYAKAKNELINFLKDLSEHQEVKQLLTSLYELE